MFIRTKTRRTAGARSSESRRLFQTLRDNLARFNSPDPLFPATRRIISRLIIYLSATFALYSVSRDANNARGEGRFTRKNSRLPFGGIKRVETTNYVSHAVIAAICLVVIGRLCGSFPRSLAFFPFYSSRRDGAIRGRQADRERERAGNCDASHQGDDRSVPVLPEGAAIYK